MLAQCISTTTSGANCRNVPFPRTTNNVIINSAPTQSSTRPTYPITLYRRFRFSSRIGKGALRCFYFAMLTAALQQRKSKNSKSEVLELEVHVHLGWRRKIFIGWGRGVAAPCSSLKEIEKIYQIGVLKKLIFLLKRNIHAVLWSK